MKTSNQFNLNLKIHVTLLIPFAILVTAGKSYAQHNATMDVHVINVGQGSAALLEFPCGVILVDTGGENNDEFHSTDALVSYLETFFAGRPDLNRTIDLLMISHPHKDHTYGVKDVVSRYTIKNIITNGQSTGSGKAGQIFLHKLVADREGTPDTLDDIGFYESIMERIPDGGFTNAVIDPINCAGADPSIKLLWGHVLNNPGWSKDDYGDENNHSVVCKIDYGKASIILTGDLETKAIEALLLKHSNHALFDSDVYLVGHHGSDNGTTLSFLKATTPQMAVLSFGDPNRELSWTAWAYGHPNKGIISLLADHITGTRKPVTVMVGNGAKKFQTMPLTKAVYGTGWDDSIVLSAKLDGTWTSNRSEGQININSADAATLATLPSIGEKRAQAIITYRNQVGRFNTIDDLDHVPGIGPATVALLRPLVKV